MRVDKAQMREFFVNYHGFGEFFALNADAALDAIFSRIRSVQFDPLNVVGRNAELVCFSRNGNITRNDLAAALYERRVLVDGWDKMMCVYRTDEFSKFAFVRKAMIDQYGLTMEWRNQRDCHNFMEEVYDYIDKHGKTLVTDIPSQSTGNGGWGPSKVAGVCCEYLWNCGRLTVAYKKGVVKAFDTTESLLGINPDENAFDRFEEFEDWYVKRRIASVGAARWTNGGAWLGAYTENGERRRKVLNRLVDNGQLTAVQVDGVNGEYYINTGDERFFEKAADDRAVFVAPLDNIIWDRKTVKDVFDFEYSWEVYTPAAKRKFGYYVLPILIGSRFIGRIEPTLSKKKDKLTVKNIWFEKEYTPTSDDIRKISAEIKRLAAFLNVDLVESVETLTVMPIGG